MTDYYYRSTAKFCSVECSAIGRKQTRYPVSCATCGTTLMRTANRLKKAPFNSYCNRECQQDKPKVYEKVAGYKREACFTKPERIGYYMLDLIGVPYLKQEWFERKFIPDATIPSLKIVVQFDGDYWHDRKGTSQEPRILNRVKSDKWQDAYLKKLGWKVIRLWEGDLICNPQYCMDILRKEILPL